MVAPAKGTQPNPQTTQQPGPQPAPQVTTGDKANKPSRARDNAPDFKEWEFLGQLRIGVANVGDSKGPFLVFPKADSFGFTHVGGVFGFMHDVNKQRVRVGLGGTLAYDGRFGNETTFGSKWNVFTVNAAAQLSLRYLTTLPGKASFISLLPNIRLEGGVGYGWGDTAVADIGTSTFDKSGVAGRLSASIDVIEFFRIWSLGMYMSATATRGKEGDVFSEANVADRHIGFQTTVRLGKATVEKASDREVCDKANDKMFTQNWGESTGDKNDIENLYLPKLKEDKLIAPDAKRTDVTPAFIDRLAVVDEAVMSLLHNPEVKMSKDQLKQLRSNLMLSSKSLEDIRKKEDGLDGILPEGLSAEAILATSKAVLAAIDNADKTKAQWDKDELKVYDKDSKGNLHDSNTTPDKALATHLQERRKANMGAKEVCADATEIENLDDILEKITGRLNNALKNGEAINDHKISKDKLVMDSTFVTLREVYFLYNRPKLDRNGNNPKVDAFEDFAIKKYEAGETVSRDQIIAMIGDYAFEEAGQEVDKLIETAKGLMKATEINQANLQVDNADALEFVQKNKDQVVIGINAYTDARGKAEYNQKLSESRARIIRAIFISQGLKPESLVALGRGISTTHDESLTRDEIKRKGLSRRQQKEVIANRRRDNRRVELSIHESAQKAMESVDPSLVKGEEVVIDDSE